TACFPLLARVLRLHFRVLSGFYCVIVSGQARVARTSHIRPKGSNIGRLHERGLFLSDISAFTKNLFGAADGRLDESRLGRLKIAQDESPGLEARYAQHCDLSLRDRAGLADISFHAVS